MKVLVICENSGTVRDAFAKRGHDAWSLDVLPTEKPGNHIQDYVENRPLDWYRTFDLIIGHPPCTYLSIAGLHWLKKDAMGIRRARQRLAVEFFQFCYHLPCDRVCMENPMGFLNNNWKKPTQIVEPWMFGHPYTKKTGLWLRGLPKLKRVNPHYGPTEKWVRGKGPAWWGGKCEDGGSGYDWKKASLTFQGIADAMADQWGSIPT